MSRYRPRRVLLTLIHGTWGQESDWWKSDSDFVRAIRVSLPADVKLDVESFEWSGRNSARERRTWAGKLSEHIQRCARDYPEADHFLVGRSHGGTVAVLGAHQTAVKGVVCLATPFVHCWPRKCDGLTRVSQYLFGGLWLLLGLLLVAIVGGGDGVTPALVLKLDVAALMAFVLLERAEARIEAFATTVSERFRLPKITSELLIVRAAGDEASLALAVGRLIAWLVEQVEHAAQIVGAFLIFFFAILGVWWFFYWIIPDGGHAWPEAWALLKRLPFFLSYLTLLIPGFVFGLSIAMALPFPLGVPLFLCSLVFGKDAPLAMLVSHLTVEETPPGAWVVHQMSEGDFTATNEAIRHSSILSDPSVKTLIAAWVGERAGAAGTVVQTI